MKVDFIIDGASAPAASGATYARRDPVTGAVASEAAAAGEADVANAVEAAARAFPAWSQTGPSERRALLLKAADLLEARAGEFTQPMIEEIGATAPWAGFNVHFAASMLREAAGLTTQILGEIIPADKPGVISLAVRQPAGVVLGMAPWNAPVILGVRAIAAPLACGNTVILRSSEVCPATHRLIGQIMNDAGFPKGVVNVISNAPADAPKVVAALIAHPAVKRVNFTGSSKVGRTIAKLAAEHLKPVLLELGGKAPLIVLDDADIDAAVDAAVFGAFANQGDPRGHVVLGSLVDMRAAERMDELIADAVGKGAKVVAGGGRKGTIVEATVIDHVTPSMRIYGEESFGPVKPVVRVNGEEEAVRVANDTEYGLSAAVFSRDVRRALQVAKRIESGICHINGPTVHDEAQMPFGGVKASGYGRFGGRSVINEFTDLRWITIEGPQHYPF
jgi:acyl-CoA reductase-like NAD-dependent aldehyde dehydrogenase